jgi:hypothetical protein
MSKTATCPQQQSIRTPSNAAQGPLDHSADNNLGPRTFEKYGIHSVTIDVVGATAVTGLFSVRPQSSESLGR